MKNIRKYMMTAACMAAAALVACTEAVKRDTEEEIQEMTVPKKPGPITKVPATLTCNGGEEFTFSVSKVQWAETYEWTIAEQEKSKISIIDGQGTNVITVRVVNDDVVIPAQSVSVVAKNELGASKVREYFAAITVSVPIELPGYTIKKYGKRWWMTENCHEAGEDGNLGVAPDLTAFSVAGLEASHLQRLNDAKGRYYTWYEAMTGISGCTAEQCPYVQNYEGVDDVGMEYLRTEEFLRKSGSLRGSVMIVGPLVARFGRALIPKPGGDKIGRRRLDTHFVGIQKLGACFSYDAERQVYEIEARQLKGAYMLLDEASVTGTANILMAAVLAEGVTTIYNAACEPYLQQLSTMLNRMGARISGVGSNLLTIEGVRSLSGTEHTILPDMIEVGSFIGMAAMTGSEITIKNTGYDKLGIIPDAFRRLGITVEQRGDDIYIPRHDSYEIDTFIDGSIMTIADAPWPGLTPDLLSVFLVVATQSVGSVLIHQKMFESRLFFVDKLIDMGAQIILCDPHRATVIGLGNRFKLRGSTMVSPDIRAGIALLIAAMSAEGTSTIHNIDQIDRGYQGIDKRLNRIGEHSMSISRGFKDFRR